MPQLESIPEMSVENSSRKDCKSRNNTLSMHEGPPEKEQSIQTTKERTNEINWKTKLNHLCHKKISITLCVLKRKKISGASHFASGFPGFDDLSLHVQDFGA